MAFELNSFLSDFGNGFNRTIESIKSLLPSVGIDFKTGFRCKFTGSSTGCEPIDYGFLNSDIRSPFVKVTFFNDSSNFITVGNESSKVFNNSAAIQSFEYGASNGLTITIVVIDVNGGSFDSFLEGLVACNAEIVGKFSQEIIAEWGWITADKNNGNIGKKSKRVRARVQNIEYELDKGISKYTITAVDGFQYKQVKRGTNSGKTSYSGSLKTAIEEYCKDIGIKVKFINANGKEDFDFFINPSTTTNDTEAAAEELNKQSGPNAISFRVDNDQPKTVIESWVSKYYTKGSDGGKRSVRLLWDIGEQNETLIIREIKEDSKSSPIEFPSVGPFLVNAGPCSPVLDFKVKLNYVAPQAHSNMVGGTPGGAAAAGGVKSDDESAVGKPITEKGVGMGMSGTVTNDAKVIYSSDAAKETTGALDAFIKVNSKVPGIPMPVEADMTLIGTPDVFFLGEVGWIGKNICVVYINPPNLQVQNKVDSNCPEFIASPVCNRHFTSKYWRTTSVQHRISDGHYVLSVQMVLFVPGSEYKGKLPGSLCAESSPFRYNCD